MPASAPPRSGRISRCSSRPRDAPSIRLIAVAKAATVNRTRIESPRTDWLSTSQHTADPAHSPSQPTQPPFGQYPVALSHRWLVGLTRRLPPRGAGKSLAHLLRRLFILTHRDIVDGEIDGLRLRVHLRGNVSERRYFFMPLLYDRAEYEFIRRTLPAGGCFVDVGANVGLYSLWSAAAAGPGGRVFALEPNPAVLGRLGFNIEINGFADRIQVLPVAAGDSAGELELWLDPTNLGGSSMRHTAGRTATRVSVRPLLAILSEAGVESIDIMKLDIEGYEDAALLPFLRTAPESLLPGAIIIEDSRERWQGDLMAELEQAGYSIRLRGRLNLILVREEGGASDDRPAPASGEEGKGPGKP